MINFNGQIGHSEIAQNRGFLYADGVFESMKIVEGKILFFEDHYFRLMASMRIMRMKIPMNFTQSFIAAEIIKCFQNSGNTGSCRITVYRNDGGKYFPHTNEISYLISFQQHDNKCYVINDTLNIVDLYNDFHISAQLLSNIKTTARNINVLASIYANENDFENVILLNEKKEVVEFYNGNLFLVFGQMIVTPPLSSGCINGIIRRQIIKILSHSPTYQIIERPISTFEIQQADELFLTNINAGILPVKQYRKKLFQTQVAFDLLKELNLICS